MSISTEKLCKRSPKVFGHKRLGRTPNQGPEMGKYRNQGFSDCIRPAEQDLTDLPEDAQSPSERDSQALLPSPSV